MVVSWHIQFCTLTISEVQSVERKSYDAQDAFPYWMNCVLAFKQRWIQPLPEDMIHIIWTWLWKSFYDDEDIHLLYDAGSHKPFAMKEHNSGKILPCIGHYINCGRRVLALVLPRAASHFVSYTEHGSLKRFCFMNWCESGPGPCGLGQLHSLPPFALGTIIMTRYEPLIELETI